MTINHLEVIEKKKLIIAEMLHQIDYCLELIEPNENLDGYKEVFDKLIKFRKQWFKKGWNNCEDCGCELEVRCPKELEEDLKELEKFKNAK